MTLSWIVEAGSIISKQSGEKESWQRIPNLKFHILALTLVIYLLFVTFRFLFTTDNDVSRFIRKSSHFLLSRQLIALHANFVRALFGG